MADVDSFRLAEWSIGTAYASISPGLPRVAQVSRLFCRGTFSLFLFSISGVAWAVTDPMDWPAWRGPSQSGVSVETGLIDQFDPAGGEGSNLLWKSEVAAGISTPIVMNGRLFTIARDSPGTPKDAEKVVCLDAVTGELLWENVYNVFLSDLPAERVGWSHVCGDPESDRIYVQGACCLFQCIDAASGRTIWAAVIERRVWDAQHLRRQDEHAHRF